jgi:hypothetical protein
MQIGAGLRRAGSAVRVVHPVDLLDASYATEGEAAPSSRRASVEHARAP